MGNGKIYAPESKFSQISNEVLRDESLHYRAKGLYATMYSYLSMSNFTLYKSYLAKHCPEGEKSFETVWKELKDSGYMIMHKLQDSSGKLYYEYELINEKNHTPKKEGMDKAGVVKAPSGKRGSINKTLGNKTLPSNTINTHPDIKTLCVDIQNILGTELSQKTIKDLIKKYTLDKVKHYMDDWDKYRDFADGGQDAFFIHCIQNDRKVPTQKKKSATTPLPHQNFEQREFVEDEYDKFYANLNNEGS